MYVACMFQVPEGLYAAMPQRGHALNVTYFFSYGLDYIDSIHRKIEDSYGLYSYGLCSSGLCSYGLYIVMGSTT